MVRLRSTVVGVPVVFPAVTGDDDVAVPQADAGVLSRTQVGVTPVAGEAHERPGERQAVALGHPPCPADVPAGTLLVALAGRLPGEFVQPLDALRGEAHTPTNVQTAPIPCAGDGPQEPPGWEPTSGQRTASGGRRASREERSDQTGAAVTDPGNHTRWSADGRHETEPCGSNAGAVLNTSERGRDSGCVGRL